MDDVICASASPPPIPAPPDFTYYYGRFGRNGLRPCEGKDLPDGSRVGSAICSPPPPPWYSPTAPPYPAWPPEFSPPSPRPPPPDPYPPPPGEVVSPPPPPNIPPSPPPPFFPNEAALATGLAQCHMPRGWGVHDCSHANDWVIACAANPLGTPARNLSGEGAVRLNPVGGDGELTNAATPLVSTDGSMDLDVDAFMNLVMPILFGTIFAILCCCCCMNWCIRGCAAPEAQAEVLMTNLPGSTEEPTVEQQRNDMAQLGVGAQPRGAFTNPHSKQPRGGGEQKHDKARAAPPEQRRDSMYDRDLTVTNDDTMAARV